MAAPSWGIRGGGSTFPKDPGDLHTTAMRLVSQESKADQVCMSCNEMIYAQKGDFDIAKSLLAVLFLESLKTFLGLHHKPPCL